MQTPALPRYALKLTAAQRANGSKAIYLAKMAAKAARAAR